MTGRPAGAARFHKNPAQIQRFDFRLLTTLMRIGSASEGEQGEKSSIIFIDKLNI